MRNFKSMGIIVPVMVAGAVAIGVLWSQGSPTLAQDGEGSDLATLLKERLATWREIVQMTEQQFESGNCSFGSLHQARKGLAKAELDSCNSKQERLVVLAKMLNEEKEYENFIAQTVAAGQENNLTDALMAKADRLQVEIDLQRERGKDRED
jgi:outer membrane protein TolC